MYKRQLQEEATSYLCKSDSQRLQATSFVLGPRRVCIRASVEIAKYGKALLCPGCEAIVDGGPATSHSEVCRERIMAEMKKDDGLGPRVQAADENRF